MYKYKLTIMHPGGTTINKNIEADGFDVPNPGGSIMFFTLENSSNPISSKKYFLVTPQALTIIDFVPEDEMDFN
jgi:hypothetical protein